MDALINFCLFVLRKVRGRKSGGCEVRGHSVLTKYTEYPPVAIMLNMLNIRKRGNIDD